MNWANRFIMGLGLLVILAAPAFARPSEANEFTRIAPNRNASLSTEPAILGSFEITGSGASGNVTIWDSPDGTSTHAQAVVVAEAGVTADRSSFSSGTINRVTNFGLFVESNNVEVIVQFGT